MAPRLDPVEGIDDDIFSQQVIEVNIQSFNVDNSAI